MMNKVRWGLIGCGDIARKRVAPALSKGAGCELVAVNRARAHLAEDFAREFGARKWYADWRELIADDEIDAVYVATPVHLHAEQTLAAAGAGKHVLCEKPMALDVEECDRMIASCLANGVRLGIAYYRHFYPPILRMKEILAAGEIGKPAIIQINAFERFDPAPGGDRYWFVQLAKAGGGPMMDFGCHRIEILLNLFGPVRGVSAVTAKALFDREVEDTSIAILTFEGDTQAVLSVTHAASGSRDTIDIFASEGSIQVPVLNQGELHIKTSAGERVEKRPPHPNLHQPLIEDFARAVFERREPQVSGEKGRAVAEVIAEIYRRSNTR
jgi:predicted dehydrogenase